MKNLIILFFGGLLFTMGCSRMDMAYSFAPRLAANQLEDAFDLSSARYHKIKDSIAKDLKENKGQIKTDLEALIDSLSLVADKKSLDSTQISEFFDTGKKLQFSFIMLLKPSFDEVLGSMSRPELEHLKDFSEEKFKKSEEKLADVEKFKKASLESFEKQMDTFFDSVADEQRKLYVGFLTENFEYYKFQTSVRKSFVSKLDSLFETKPEMVSYVIKYYAGDDSVKSDEYKKRQKAYFQNMKIAAGGIWQSLTDKQRSEFKKTLANMRADLEKL